MSYLIRKSNIYYANLTIPPEVRHMIGRGVRFYQSTKCKSEAEAQRRANALVVGWKAEIAKAQSKLPNVKDTFSEFLRTCARSILLSRKYRDEKEIRQRHQSREV